MVGFTSVRTDEANKRLAEYIEKVRQLDTVGLIAEFLSYLDYTEETDSGRVFHPITISSCRVLMSEPLSVVLDALRQRADGYNGCS